MKLNEDSTAIKLIPCSSQNNLMLKRNTVTVNSEGKESYIRHKMWANWQTSVHC